MGITGARATIYYTLGDTVRSIRANFMTAVLSSVTVGFALAIFALFAIALVNLDAVISKWGERTHVVVYTDRGSVEKAGPGPLRDALGGIAGVEDVRYVSSEEALELLKVELEGHGGLLEGIGADPLPASFEITLGEGYRTRAGLQGVVNKLQAMVWVEDVQYGLDWVEKLTGLLSFIKLAALLIGSFLAAAVLFIISNTIRLAVFVRGEEVEIMRYLGATDAFIKVPFFLEGVVQGVAGGALALVVVKAGTYVLAAGVPPYMSFVVEIPFSDWALLAVLMTTGAVLGAAGSLLSLGRFLKTRT